MFRKFALSGLLAASIAATPIAAPQAQAADPHDIIGGALALGLIGALIVNEQNKSKASKQQVYVDPHNQARTHRHGNRTHTHVYRGHHNHDFRRQVKRSKPRECLRKRWTRDGWVRYYSKRCLRSHGY